MSYRFAGLKRRRQKCHEHALLREEQIAARRGFSSLRGAAELLAEMNRRIPPGEATSHHLAFSDGTLYLGVWLEPEQVWWNASFDCPGDLSMASRKMVECVLRILEVQRKDAPAPEVIETAQKTHVAEVQGKAQDKHWTNRVRSSVVTEDAGGSGLVCSELPMDGGKSLFAVIQKNVSLTTALSEGEAKAFVEGLMGRPLGVEDRVLGHTSSGSWRCLVQKTPKELEKSALRKGEAEETQAAPVSLESVVGGP
jgi:hypothetical protein